MKKCAYIKNNIHIRIEVKEYSFIVINLGITACI